MNERTRLLSGGTEFVTGKAYSRSDSMATTMLAALSIFALILLVYSIGAIFICAFKKRASESSGDCARPKTSLFFISLISCLFFQALGSLLNWSWISRNGVYEGRMCTVQGLFNHFTDVGIAVWIFVIAALIANQLRLHETYTLQSSGTVQDRMTSHRTTHEWAIFATGWLFILTVIVVGIATANAAKRGDYYGISGNWCWITKEYAVEIVLFATLIMLLSAFVSFSISVAAIMRLRHKFRDEKSDPMSIVTENHQLEESQVLFTKRMVLYPVAYFFCALPIVFTRFTSLSNRDVPLRVNTFAQFVYLAAGIVMVIIFLSNERFCPSPTCARKHRTSGQDLLQRPASVIQPEAPPSIDRPPTYDDPHYCSARATYENHEDDMNVPERFRFSSTPRLPEDVHTRKSSPTPLHLLERHFDAPTRPFLERKHSVPSRSISTFGPAGLPWGAKTPSQLHPVAMTGIHSPRSSMRSSHSGVALGNKPLPHRPEGLPANPAQHIRERVSIIFDPPPAPTHARSTNDPIRREPSSLRTQATPSHDDTNVRRLSRSSFPPTFYGGGEGSRPSSRASSLFSRSESRISGRKPPKHNRHAANSTHEHGHLSSIYCDIRRLEADLEGELESWPSRYMASDASDDGSSLYSLQTTRSDMRRASRDSLESSESSDTHNAFEIVTRPESYIPPRK